MKKTVIELFAGVGGFRVGLNDITKIDQEGKAIEEGNFSFVWANQWEPSTKAQDAYNCYVEHFGFLNTSNVDISTVDKQSIPTHTLLVGGFPCQDYSVARTISNEKGIEGKKGVLWWQIRDIIEAKKPPFVLLENVDRLIKSPANQRGRDFGVILSCFDNLGYFVEWRVINAANYGMPQRRRRLYIFAYRKTTHFAKSLSSFTPEDVLLSKGCIANTFLVEQNLTKYSTVDIRNSYKTLADLSESFSFQFHNTGYMRNGVVYTCDTNPILKNPTRLIDIIEHDVDDSYFLTEGKIQSFSQLRAGKRILRTAESGFQYYYTEGAMSKFDDLYLPGRTMLTSESSLNRSTHIIIDPDREMPRLLTPIECERLNMFPDNWTNTNMSKYRRYFVMGNALVCGVIKEFGVTINSIIEKEK